MKAWIVAALLVARVAAAEEPADFVMYKVKQGDSIDLVAAEFYGDHVRTSLFIVDENKWKTYRKLNPGERIRVPITREITTAKGDTLSALATKYLGDANRATYIAQLNNLQVTDMPAAGVVLRLPFRITHVAQTTESLSAISQFYFGDAKQTELLRAYNNLGDKTAIEKNDSIIVPVMNLRVHDERLPSASSEALARRKQHADANEAAAAALPIARLAELQGSYADVAKALAEVGKKLEYLDEPMLGEVGMLLGKALVASGDKAGATAVFAEVVAREPTRKLSPYYESPTVIDAWRAASGHVAGE
ncbi:MAG TPA: LysM domain-containing protein [Kofleriaceae bacterium]|nr:LysM domain-containing protein [Kofleriaceae bacterium]